MKIVGKIFLLVTGIIFCVWGVVSIVNGITGLVNALGGSEWQPIVSSIFTFCVGLFEIVAGLAGIVSFVKLTPVWFGRVKICAIIMFILLIISIVFAIINVINDPANWLSIFWPSFSVAVVVVYFLGYRFCDKK